MRIRIFAIFKKTIYISALEPFLRSNGIETIATCSNTELAIEQYKRLKADLVLMDVNWSDRSYSVSGDSVIRKLKQENPAVKIIGVTSFFDSRVLEKLKTQEVQGYFFKSMDDTLEQVKQCIIRVLAGETYYAGSNVLSLTAHEISNH